VEEIIRLHFLHQLGGPEGVAQIAPVEVEPFAQMLDAPIVAMDDAMHFQFISLDDFRFGGGIIEQIFCQMTAGKPGDSG
jgi:hypothetical protein